MMATVDALVTATDEPLENPNIHHDHSLGQTQVLVTGGSGAIVGVRGVRLDADHWLVQGMTVPVSIDPANPNAYEIDWDNVPSIQDRVAANDPSLLDPMAARLKTWDALAAAGYHEPDLDQVAPQLLAAEMSSLRAQLVAEPEAFARQLLGVAGLAAPEGHRRALVQIVTTTEVMVSTMFGTNMHRDRFGSHSVVLSVSAPGQPPYAVYVKSFDHEERLYDENNPGLPALVSLDDPTDVQVLWDEMQTQGDQEQAYKDREREYKEQQKAASKNPAPAPAPTTLSPAAAAGPVTPPNVSPQVRAIMIANAQKQLLTADPATRQTLIDTYHAMGMDLEG